MKPVISDQIKHFPPPCTGISVLTAKRPPLSRFSWGQSDTSFPWHWVGTPAPQQAPATRDAAVPVLPSQQPQAAAAPSSDHTPALNGSPAPLLWKPWQHSASQGWSQMPTSQTQPGKTSRPGQSGEPVASLQERLEEESWVLCSHHSSAGSSVLFIIIYFILLNGEAFQLASPLGRANQDSQAQ